MYSTWVSAQDLPLFQNSSVLSLELAKYIECRNDWPRSSPTTMLTKDKTALRKIDVDNSENYLLSNRLEAVSRLGSYPLSTVAAAAVKERCSVHSTADEQIPWRQSIHWSCLRRWHLFHAFVASPMLSIKCMPTCSMWASNWCDCACDYYSVLWLFGFQDIYSETITGPNRF